MFAPADKRFGVFHFYNFARLLDSRSHSSFISAGFLDGGLQQLLPLKLLFSVKPSQCALQLLSQQAT